MLTGKPEIFLKASRAILDINWAKGLQGQKGTLREVAWSSTAILQKGKLPYMKRLENVKESRNDTQET